MVAGDLKRQLAGRALIDQAKRLMMESGMSEDQAYHDLQAGARRRQISLSEMAQRIINQA